MSAPEPSEVDRRLKRAVSNLSVLVARKTDFVNCALRGFQSKLTQSRISFEEPAVDRLVRADLIEIVAQIDWRMFVTSDEIERRVLNLETRLEELNRRAIWREIEQQIGSD
jgi:hypothetical protein